MTANQFRVGDLADHKSGQLDPRPVAAVEGDTIRLDIFGLVTDPVLAANYDLIAADVCTCVFSCEDHPATACSLSGQWHVHPDDGAGVFGPCPEHPDAPGDL